MASEGKAAKVIMDEQIAVFEQCKSSEEIDTQLQYLTKKFLESIHSQQTGHLHKIGENDIIDLRMFSELSHADLKHYSRPVFLLSGICRLLIKQGTQESLRFCLNLSHVIYTFQCKHHESWYISYLYKGISQIGLNLPDLGVKNVLLAISGDRDSDLIPLDTALGYWALTSAAIINRNIKLALTFAEKWRNIAQKGHLTGEMFNANITILLFHLLLGDSEQSLQLRQSILTSPRKEWEDVMHFLYSWTEAISRRNDIEIVDVFEPFPLFLGFMWYKPASENNHVSDGDFSSLCHIRRSLCHEEAADRLSIEEVEAFANCLAQWELPKPLYDLETILKQKAADKNLEYIMTRLLGKRVLESVTTKTPLTPDVITQENAIILVMDVRKFSELSEHRAPEEIFDILNPIFKIMNEELEQVGGTILEFVGDCIIIVFNTFQNPPSDMSAILYHSIRSLQRLHVLNALSLQTDRPEIQIGVGINKGSVGLGYLGGLNRCHLTVLGNTINLAARIETSTKSLPGNVIVSEGCFDNTFPEFWQKPQHINFSVRDLGQHTMRNIKQPVRLFGFNPLLRYWVDFVPMGFVAYPEKGVVYVDTGNSEQPGIIDHHFISQTAKSACELLNQQPELLLEHVKDTPLSQIEFRLHTWPDLDCAATLYTAYEFMGKAPRRETLAQLAAYVSTIDQGHIPEAEQLQDSLYGIFLAHRRIVENRFGKKFTDFILLEAELRVIDAAVYVMEQHHNNADFASIFRSQPDWFTEERVLIQKDRMCYDEDIRWRSHAYTARLNGCAKPVVGLWLDHPQSTFFKLWVQSDFDAPREKGYQFLAIDLSPSEKNRFVIRVDPESENNLEGLGQELEIHETRKRQRFGKERPIHPIRYPSDNSDPWYFGQGHRYTIVDSPYTGTILTAEEVQKIHERWPGLRTQS
ncbi:MAG: adenylate/guanylate cyclase domain-containing protein [bacterium]|nr:adenylate/guanylate cyclase domain-containing protein [bacterium]